VSAELRTASGEKYINPQIWKFSFFIAIILHFIVDRTMTASVADTNSSHKRFQDKVVVVTGAGSGIGASLAEAFDSEGAVVAVCDIDAKLADHVSSNCLTHSQRPRKGFHVDVTNSQQVRDMIQFLFKTYGRIDIYCSNAGVIHPFNQLMGEISDGVTRYSDSQWNRLFRINTLSHVIAARELLPVWSKHKPIAKPSFVVTASAAGLLTQIGDASYGVTKAGAVSFAEHLTIEHGDSIHVLCICPQAVDTPFGNGMVQKTNNVAKTDGIISPRQVATRTLDALVNRPQDNDSSMFIFPHPQVEMYMKRKGMDHARWLKGMRRFKQSQQQRMQTSRETTRNRIRSKL
jgi:NAD(P)-dependent dehydrogenase (short-subunit alcohol dehydrogenase family)